MWTWTCTACGEVFTGETKREAEGKFIDHARAEHNPKTIVSTESGGAPSNENGGE